MTGSSFREFAELCEKLAETSERNAKIQLVASYLKALSPEDAKAAAYLLVGNPSGEKRREPINVGWATVSEALEGGKVATLLQSELTIQDVLQLLRSMAKQEGPGSRGMKKAILQSLLSRAGPLEEKWLLRIIFGEMRHGVSHGLLLDALAQVAGVDAERIRRFDMLVGDLGELAEKTLKRELETVELKPFNPVKPMLAEMAQSVKEALIEHGGKTIFEPKYDGVRLQIHISGGEVRLYTRRLTEVTKSLPDVEEAIRKGVRCREAIIDGEVMAVDERNRPLPFQETMKRLGREKEVEKAAAEIPLRLQLFDLLLLEGRPCIDKPLTERRRLLEEITVDKHLLTPQLLTESPEEAGAFLSNVVEQGYEGVMAKDPRSLYTPGRRGGKWLKVKPADTLDVVIIAAEWGHGRRRGWLSNYHLAVLDEETGRFEMVGKTFKGLTDKEFEEITSYLQSIKIKDMEWGVVVRPELVVEVAYNEIQQSPHYRSGYALRFARVTRIRWDKHPQEVDTLQRLKTLYEKQFEKKGRLNTGE